MNKIFYIVFSLMIFISCGSIKSSFSTEAFTAEEILIFQNALEKYKLNDHNGELHITGETGDYLLLIEGTYPAPYAPNKFQYRFTKVDGIFICRSYTNGEIVSRVENRNFEILLEQVLKIAL